MLTAEQVNVFLESFYSVSENRIPETSDATLGTSELLKGRSTFGNVVYSALVAGALTGKLTLVLDWNTAMRSAEIMLGVKLESFSPAAFDALDRLFYGYAEDVATRFSSRGVPLELRPLPCLTDAHFLLAEESGETTLKLPIQTKSGSFTLFLSFKDEPNG